MDIFSKNLKQLRKKRGLSQKDVAEGAKLSLRTYQNYEQGSREPRLSQLKSLAVYFGVTLDFLVGLPAKNKK